MRWRKLRDARMGSFCILFCFLSCTFKKNYGGFCYTFWSTISSGSLSAVVDYMCSYSENQSSQLPINNDIYSHHPGQGSFSRFSFQYHE